MAVTFQPWNGHRPSNQFTFWSLNKQYYFRNKLITAPSKNCKAGLHPFRKEKGRIKRIHLFTSMFLRPFISITRELRNLTDVPVIKILVECSSNSLLFFLSTVRLIDVESKFHRLKSTYNSFHAQGLFRDFDYWTAVYLNSKENYLLVS